MTYGQVRFQCTKRLPELDPELIDSWIEHRYTEILDEIPWTRRQARATVTSTPLYEVGTISFVEGAAAIVGTGTNWAEFLSGYRLYIVGRDEWYTFTYVSPVDASLDRDIKFTGTDLAYKLYKPFVDLPASVRILDSVIDLETGPLDKLTAKAASSVALGFGTPSAYRWGGFSSTSAMQIELIVQPDQVRAIEIEYTAEDTTFYSGPTSNTLLPWVRPACLIAGVYASGLFHLKEYTASQLQEQEFQKLLAQMKRTAVANMPPKKFRMSGEFEGGRTLDLNEFRKRLMK